MRYLFGLIALCFGTAASGVADGNLDTNFSAPKGYVFGTFDRGGSRMDLSKDLLVGPDGKLYSVGTAQTGTNEYKIAIARFLPDGSIDHTFADNGQLLDGTIPLPNVAAAQFGSDGFLVVAGSYGTYPNRKIFFCRFDPQLGLVGCFNNNYFDPVNPTNDSDVRDMVLLADGYIALAGCSGPSNISKAAVAMFGANGKPIATFGNGGTALFRWGMEQSACFRSMIQARTGYYAGMFYAVGESIAADGTTHKGYVQILDAKNGTQQFGWSGLYDVLGYLSFRDIVERRYGVFTTVGTERVNGKLVGVIQNHSASMLPLDGGAIFSLDAGDTTEFSHAVEQPDGKLVVSGRRVLGSRADLLVARFNIDSSLDLETFGPASGYSIVDLGADAPADGGYQLASGGLILHKGQPLISGSAQRPDGNYDMVVARFDNDIIFADGLEYVPN